MYSVYLVDDENLLLCSLQKSIPWLDYGFEVVGSNTSPETAIAEIVRLCPNLVITDLKMPVINGIELIRRIKDTGADTEFVILSAYGEFEASREFFLMDGLDYIVKPLDKNNAGLVLERLSRKLASKQHLLPSIQFVPSQSKSFDDLVDYVTKNFNRRHSLKDLGAAFGISPTYICDLFSRHYKSTLTIFVTNLRMYEAGRLIRETDTPLKEISIHCGYPSYYHFCRVFKENFKKAPSEYREENR